MRSVCRPCSRFAPQVATVSVVTPESAYACNRSFTRSGGPISAVKNLSYAVQYGNDSGNGSFEVMVGYEFDVKIKRVASPRYF